MWDRLEKKPSSAFEDVFLEGLDHFPLSPANIHQLQRLREKVGLPSMQFPVAHARVFLYPGSNAATQPPIAHTLQFHPSYSRLLPWTFQLTPHVAVAVGFSATIHMDVL